jgi:Ni,Fe-hydrogenase III small subunit
MPVVVEAHDHRHLVDCNISIKLAIESRYRLERVSIRVRRSPRADAPAALPEANSIFSGIDIR